MQELMVQLSCDRLEAAIVHQVRGLMASLDLQPDDTHLVESIDVAAPPSAIQANGVEATVGLDITISTTTMAAVLAAPNAAPQVSTVSVPLSWSLTLDAKSLRITHVPLDPATFPDGPTLAPLFNAALAGLDTSLDLTDALRQVMTLPDRIRGVNDSRMEVRTDGAGARALVLRWAVDDPAKLPDGSQETAPMSGVDWAVWASADLVTNTLASWIHNEIDKPAQALGPGTPDVNVTWQPSASAAGVLLHAHQNVQAPDPLAPWVDVDAEAILSIDPSGAVMDHGVLVPAVALDVSWTPSLGGDVGSELGENLLESFGVVDALTSNVPLPQGAVKTGPRSFRIETATSTKSWADVLFVPGTLTATSTGVSFGGFVKIPTDAGYPSVQVTVAPMSATFVDSCSGREQAAALGQPAPHPTQYNVFGVAAGHVSGYNRFRSVTPLGDTAAALAPWTITTTDTGDWQIRISVDAPQLDALAAAHTGTAQFLVRVDATARLLDLGLIVTVVIDADGNVSGVAIVQVDDCRHRAVDPWYAIMRRFNPLWNVDPQRVSLPDPERGINLVRPVAVGREVGAP